MYDNTMKEKAFFAKACQYLSDADDQNVIKIYSTGKDFNTFWNENFYIHESVVKI